MRSSTMVLKVLKVVTVAPGVVVSTALIWVTAALLPSPAGLFVFMAAAVLVGVLATGRLERPAVRLLADGRRLSEAEAAVLAPVLTRLTSLGIGPPAVAVYVRRRSRPREPVQPVGRASVVLSPGLVEAVYRGRVDDDAAAALIAHAAGRLRHGNTRFDLAIGLWTLPWQLISGVCRRVGAAVAWVPLLDLAWRVRAGVGIVAVVQSAAAGRIASAVVIGVFIGATYAVPPSRRAWARRVERAADEFVATHGLGEAMSRLVQHHNGHPRPLERIHRLRDIRDVPGRPQQSQLTLVR